MCVVRLDIASQSNDDDDDDELTEVQNLGKMIVSNMIKNDLKVYHDTVQQMGNEKTKNNEKVWLEQLNG